MLSKMKLVRLQKGYKNKEVAKRLNVSSAYLSMLENGSAIITSEILARLAKIYEVPAKELI